MFIKKKMVELGSSRQLYVIKDCLVDCGSAVHWFKELVIIPIKKRVSGPRKITSKLFSLNLAFLEYLVSLKKSFSTRIPF